MASSKEKPPHPAVKEKGETILEQRIKLFSPMQKGDPYVATIDGFPSLIFYGASPLVAQKRAHDWRVEQWNRVAKPKDRVPMGAS